MSEEETKKKSKGISRREFLKDAGLVAAGAAAGSTALLAACVPEKVTTLKYVCPYDSLEFDTLAALTAHVASAHPALVTTIAKFVCPYDSLEFPTLAALQAHVTAAHPPEVKTVSTFICPIDGQKFDSLDTLKNHFTTAHPGATLPAYTTLNVNGIVYNVVVKDHWSLAMTLRDQLGLFGTKAGCDMGQCGACTVLADGVPILACIMLACEVGNQKITTIEGLSDGITLSPIQQKFWDNHCVQCGYCTPGFIMAAQGLLNVNPKPTADDVRLALSGHLCMCQLFKRTVETVVGGI